MIARATGVVLIVLSLCACAASPPAAPPPGDARIDLAWRAAGLAFARGHFDQAARLYAEAIEHAQARDDGAALGDLGYELAVTQLRRGDPEASLAASAAARAELRRHGSPTFPELDLVEAVALQRAGRSEQAERAATALIETGGPVARRARFVLGLIAAERGDVAALSAQLAALGPSAQTEWRADRAELAARRAALEGDHAAAGAGFLAAADARREVLDYPGMARALAGAGASAAAAGDRAAAAALYLRAGRSQMLADGGAARAREWLSTAERIARDIDDRAVLAAIEGLRARRP